MGLAVGCFMGRVDLFCTGLRWCSFPIDVTAGALYGIFVGWLFYLLFKKLQPDF